VAKTKSKRTQTGTRESEGGIIPKELLSREIASILRKRDLTQTEAARIMDDAPSQVSLVVTGKLRGFSTERLLRMLARLGRDVDIVIRPTEGRRRTGKVRVLRGN
jgi:predicted XRE-type DNA-binding protein